jgi:hypothetical protein
MVLASLSQNSVLYGRCWYVNSSSQRYLLQPVLNETRGYPPVSYLCLLCRIICSRTTTAQGESDRLDITICFVEIRSLIFSIVRVGVDWNMEVVADGDNPECLRIILCSNRSQK